MTRTAITIDTRDGACPASVFRPSSAGPWPALLFFMDGIGIRPALFDMGEKMAAHGYFVLLPDMFYRGGPYESPSPAKLFSDADFRQKWFAQYASTVTLANVRSDLESFLAFLAQQPDVKQPRVGTTGYCMGGRISMWAAGSFPDRVAAAAAYHPARLATDDGDSPHLLAPHIKANVYVAQASEDASFPDDMRQRFDDALTQANVRHTIEKIPAKHGWVPGDSPVHDAAQAERHWQTLFALLDAELK